MLQNAINSLIAGGLLSLVLFIPIVIVQYRRYGEIAEIRLGLLCALLVYSSALVAYTMFPLPDPQSLTDSWCARRVSFNPDPLDGVRRVQTAVQGLTPRQALLDKTVLEIVFNVALFVPLGWFGRRVLEWRVLTTALVGFGVSLLIEVTQFTGVYGIFRCAYRMADAVDLVTNTTGTLVGIALAAAFPRLFPSMDQLEADADRAREVDRGRRWLGQALDAFYFVVALAVVGFLIALAFDALGWASRSEPEPVFTALMWAANLLAIGFALISFTGDGSSMGQRTTYLRPKPEPGTDRAARWRRLLRPFTVMVPVAVLVFGQPTLPGRLAGMVWAGVAVGWILFSRRGLSGFLSGVDFIDNRRHRPTKTSNSVGIDG
ncbi:VanZ family protein [Luteococcus sp. Sow4_B9]|uniref:VanZ family protein n=1 Tax=Luteococcus sp. Sow4_B9 TaxID=3438792 RepID=UPI003F95F72D